MDYSIENLFRLEDRIEIIIITYNRYQYLSNTLRMLEPSPFSGCKITIIDNCSPDATREAAASYHDRFPNLHYIRNRINISGNPNYLKAIEFSSSEYTWILCDDDDLDFSDSSDIVEAVVSGEYDLVEVGATEGGTWPRGRATSVMTMINQGIDYHFRMSFFPAYIFRTALFDSNCFCWGYKNIDRLYPQFEFLNKSVRENFSIYLAKNRIVIRNEVNDHSFFPLDWYASWVSCCRTIQDRRIRARAIEDATVDRGFSMCLAFWSVLDRKMNKDGKFWLRVVELFLAYNAIQRFKYLLLLPFALLPCPVSFWIWVRAAIYRLKKVPENEVPSICFLDRG